MKITYWEKHFYYHYSQEIANNPKYKDEIIKSLQKDLQDVSIKLQDKIENEVNSNMISYREGLANAISTILGSSTRYFANRI